MSRYDDQFSSPDNRLTVKKLRRKFENGQLHFRPITGNSKYSWQRLPWWKRPRKILLINSIYTGVTMPAIFAYEDDEDNFYLVDGQQRCTAIMEFLNDGLKLTHKGMMERDNVQLHPDLEGKRFSDLTNEQQDRILDYNLRAEVINGDNRQDPEFFRRVKQEFHILNTTAGTMGAAEIKRSIFQGDMIDLMFDLQKSLGFVGPDQKDTSVNMRDVQANYLLAQFRVASPTAILRMQDIDMLLQLAYMVTKKGPQHKEDGLEDFCRDNIAMSTHRQKKLMTEMFENFVIITRMQSEEFAVDASEFRKWHDFYSLYAAVDELRREGVLSGRDDLEAHGSNLDWLSIGLVAHKKSVESPDLLKEWKDMADQIPSAIVRKIPGYNLTKQRDWNVTLSREIRRDLIKEVLSRRNRI